MYLVFVSVALVSPAERESFSCAVGLKERNIHFSSFGGRCVEPKGTS